MKNVIFFDLETTGFSRSDEILSIGMVNPKGEILLDTLVKPSCKKEWKEAEAINNISPQMVQNAPSMEELQEELNQILQNADILISYGISFDYRFLENWLFPETKEKLTTKCCLSLAKKLYPGISHKLSNMMDFLDLKWTGNAHTALPDAEACRKVWQRLKELGGNLNDKDN